MTPIGGPGKRTDKRTFDSEGRRPPGLDDTIGRGHFGQPRTIRLRLKYAHGPRTSRLRPLGNLLRHTDHRHAMNERITLVTNMIDKVGGLERYVDELATRLVPREFSVTIIAKRPSPGPLTVEQRLDGVTVVRTWVPTKRLPWFALEYAVGIPYVSHREIRRHGRGSIIHGHFFAPMLGPALQALDYIYTFHGPVYQELLDERQDTYFLPSRGHKAAVELTKRAERFVINKARSVTVLSEFMRDKVDELGAHPRHSIVLPGGVDTSRFAPGVSARPAWAEAASPLLLCARRLAKGKGVLELVQAMPWVLKQLPRAMLVIAGSGAEKVIIEQQVEQLRLGRSVHLVGDVSGADLVNWMRTADLCVVPTQRPEPFGLVTVEALACGTPVMATPGGASRRLLGSLDRRLIFAGIAPQDLASGICEAAKDQAFLLRIAERARKHVHPRYSWDHVADRWAAEYRGFGKG